MNSKDQMVVANFAQLSKKYNSYSIKGDEYLQKLNGLFRTNELSSIFIDSSIRESVLRFILFGEDFSIRIETKFENGFIRIAYLTTYLYKRDEEKTEKITEMEFDEIGNIGRIYSLQDFAFVYLDLLLTSYTQLSEKENYRIGLKKATE